MNQTKVHEMFSDESFQWKSIEQVIALAGADHNLTRLIVVYFPMENRSMYFVEKNRVAAFITTDFKAATKAFRELI